MTPNSVSTKICSGASQERARETNMDSDPGTRETPNMSSVCTFRFAERCVLFLCGVRCLLSAAVKNMFSPCGVRVSTFFALVSMIRWSFFPARLFFTATAIYNFLYRNSPRVS